MSSARLPHLPAYDLNDLTLRSWLMGVGEPLNECPPLRVFTR